LKKSAVNLKSGWVKESDVNQPDSNAGNRIFCVAGFDWRAADAYLFDIDGTLLNSKDAVHYWALHKAVREIFSLELDVAGVPIHGNTDIGIFRGFMEKYAIAEAEWLPKLPQLVAMICEEVERNAADLRPRLCPSIGKLIPELHARGKLLGVASGNLERVGWAKLAACGLKQYFSFGSFSDRNEKRDDIFRYGLNEARRRLHPDAKVYIVGDTPADIASAQANQLPVIAVATGIYETHELQAHSPEMCVPCCTDLLAFDKV
jgi:phosphoglycolate phosphatase